MCPRSSVRGPSVGRILVAGDGIILLPLMTVVTILSMTSTKSCGVVVSFSPSSFSRSRSRWRFFFERAHADAFIAESLYRRTFPEAS
jgi:hypothetical protein